MRQSAPAMGLLATGLVLGSVADILFYDHYPALGVTWLVILTLIAVIGWAFYTTIPLSVRRLWLVLPIVFFAVMWAIRANEGLKLFSFLTIFGLIAVFIDYLRGDKFVDQAPIYDLFVDGLAAGIMTWFSATPVIKEASKNLGQYEVRDIGQYKSVLSGLALALPILLIFGVLFSSADVVFAHQIKNALDLVFPDNVSSIFAHIVLIGFVTWLTTGLLYVALVWTATPATTADDDPPKRIGDQIITPSSLLNIDGLNMTQTSIILGSVTLMFAFFVGIQFTYLFGGRSVAGVELTFSEYARRGFFELVVVVVMVLGLILALDWITQRDTNTQKRIFRVFSILLVVETLIILISAWRRMSLYEDAYGFTELRINTHVFMIWLAFLLGMSLLSVFRVRKHIFSFGLLLMMIGYLGTLNLINVDRVIAERNIERYYNGHELDICYLTTLSADALPELIVLYTETEDREIIGAINNWLYRQEIRLRDRYTSYFMLAEYNYSERQVWEVTQTMELKSGSSSYDCDQRLTNRGS